jgi:hypothetical protein
MADRNRRTAHGEKKTKIPGKIVQRQSCAPFGDVAEAEPCDPLAMKVSGSPDSEISSASQDKPRASGKCWQQLIQACTAQLGNVFNGKPSEG